MLCDMCKENPATVHFVKVVNGTKQELNICEKCASKSQQGFGMGADIKMDAPFTFQNILSGLVDYINKSSQNVRTMEASCPKCGMSYSEFKQSGLMGCSQCYESFGPAILPVIKRVQGNVEHIGKIPLKAGKEIMGKKRLSELKEQLQRAILGEEYEKAAEIRDKIRELQNEGKEV
jgi:protein arginine kinase activator